MPGVLGGIQFAEDANYREFDAFPLALQAEFFLAQLNLPRLYPLCFGGLHLRLHGLAFPTSGHGSSLLDYSMTERRTAFSRLRLCLVQGCGYRAKGQERMSKPAISARCTGTVGISNRGSTSGCLNE